MFKSTAANASVALRAKLVSPRCGWSASQLTAVAVVLALLSAAALFIDATVARLAREHSLPGELRRLIQLSEFFGWGGTVALIIAAAAILDPRGWRVALRLAAAAYGGGILADCAKLLVARLRPSAAALDGNALDTFVSWLPLLHRDELGRPYGYALQSFPSAHAATAGGLAVGLALLYPRGRWLFALFALQAAIQRVESLAHFPSDVLCGAAIGCVMGAASACLLAPRQCSSPTSALAGPQVK